MNNKLAVTFLVAIAASYNCAKSQTLTWLEKDVRVTSNAYLPKLGSDQLGNFVLIGQPQTGTSALTYGTGPFTLPKRVSWNPSATVPGANGHAPAIGLALFSNFYTAGPYYEAAIDVYQDQGGSGSDLNYQLGVATAGGASGIYSITPTLNWTTPGTVPVGTTAYNPAVAIDLCCNSFSGTSGVEANTVVVVYQEAAGSSTLWSIVGSMSVNPSGVPAIVWGQPVPFGAGSSPSVAISDGQVIEVYQGSTPGMLVYSTGVLSQDGETVLWNASVEYSQGYSPSVAILNEGQTSYPPYVIEVHQQSNVGEGVSTNLLYQTGTYPANSATVTWNPPASYDTGCYPTIGVDGRYAYGTTSYAAVELHSKGCRAVEPLYYDVASFNY